ncbi:sensor histidine kinase [Archangium primigenium]|uniref:sensor histidine kinase n=1 Tax=[Archangium] primigenium TaxID=2792470 RepID=UPI00195DF8EF|nr:HAMP domain-containing sensor histidine kinase [Archangium primigenium]MBM7115477.1 HAMP domain-containing histidine kinase [Archangium primigenium]
MLRRLLPTLLALGCGLLALFWGLWSLQRLFIQERADARAQLRISREALEEYATQSLRHTLGRQLETDLPAIHAAMGDPLAPGEGYFLRFRELQFLPRATRPVEGASTPARRHYRALVEALDTGTSPDAAWGERLTRLREARAALDKNPARAETLATELLRYHAEHPLPLERELPFLLVLLERLAHGPTTPTLVRALLREGLPEDFGGIARSAGLQRDLLRSRSRLTAPDFEFLRAHTTRVSAMLGEPFEDFLARAREADAGMLVLPGAIVGPTLYGERWYVEPREDVVRGIAVDLDALLDALSQELRAKGHFGVEGRVWLKTPDAMLPLEDLRLGVSVPQWTRAEEAIEERYGLKTLLVGTCGLLAVAIGVMAVVAQRGRYRYIELKSDFVATVSHELRTPLASIRLMAETLERKLAQAPPETRAYPERIVQAADGLGFLVENILSFNRIDKGRWTLRRSPVRWEELASMLRADLQDGGGAVPVHFTSDTGDARVDADPALLRLLLANLVRNARAYNRRSPVELRLRAYASQGEGQDVVVFFEDNGIGIPEGEWENVFHDFYRLDAEGSLAHGSGLGLALCRKIMALHGGRISIETSGPQGTTFCLRFPPSPAP